MSGSPEEKTPDQKPHEEVKKKSGRGSWITPALFVMIAVILLMLALLIIAGLQVGFQCCCVPVCSGEMWYNCLFGSF